MAVLGGRVFLLGGGLKYKFHPMGGSNEIGFRSDEAEAEKSLEILFQENMADLLGVDSQYFEQKIAIPFQRFVAYIRSKLAEERAANCLTLGIGNSQRKSRFTQDELGREDLLFLWKNITAIFDCSFNEAARFVWPSFEEFLFMQKMSLFAASGNQTLTGIDFNQ